MKQDCLISIIIPVYNVDSYLSFCIDSIQNQTYNNWEAILVDDGSTDRSSILCDEIALKDKRFRTIHKSNDGQSLSRNAGLTIAKGEYICFIDSDDYIHKDYLLILYNAIKENTCSLAIAMMKNTKSYNETDVLLPIAPKILNQHQLMQRLFGVSGQDVQYQSACNNMYSRNLLEGVRFIKTSSEDTEFNSRVFARVDKAVLLNNPMYYYVQREGSFTHSKINKNSIDVISSYHIIYKNLQNEQYQALCLIKLYKRILSVRRLANGSSWEIYTNRLIRDVKEGTWRHFFKNPYILLKDRIVIVSFYFIPFFYELYIRYRERTK